MRSTVPSFRGQLSQRGRLAMTARMVWQAPREARFPFRPATEIRGVQAERVRATVEYAYRHVPYYRETMRKLGLVPADLRGAADLARLPLIERADLQRDPEYFASAPFPASARILTRSGGSTGKPVTVFRDPASYFADAAQRERQRVLVARLAGRRLRYREAFVGPPDGATLRAMEAFRRRTVLPVGVRVRRGVFATLHGPEELLPAIERFRPHVIAGHGSYLDALLLHIRDSGAWPPPARVVRFGADALSDAARQFVQAKLGIEVLGTYGAIETPMIGFECEEHRGYHLNVDLCPLRLVGPEGNDVAPGDSGEVVVSNLVNRGTILLNYRLGDLARSVPGLCPCGRTLPMLSDLVGRHTAWIHLGQGQRFHPQGVRAIIRREPDLREFQLVQEERRRFLLRLVVSGECEREETAERIRTGLGEALGRDAAIRIEYVVDLPRSQGKQQPIVTLPPSGSG